MGCRERRRGGRGWGLIFRGLEAGEEGGIVGWVGEVVDLGSKGRGGRHYLLGGKGEGRRGGIDARVSSSIREKRIWALQRK